MGLILEPVEDVVVVLEQADVHRLHVAACQSPIGGVARERTAVVLARPQQLCAVCRVGLDCVLTWQPVASSNGVTQSNSG